MQLLQVWFGAGLVREDAPTGDDAVMLRRSPGAVAVAEVATDHALSLMKWCVLTRC
jgi:hypothetical protein